MAILPNNSQTYFVDLNAALAAPARSAYRLKQTEPGKLVLTPRLAAISDPFGDVMALLEVGLSLASDDDVCDPYNTVDTGRYETSERAREKA